ncbi:CDF-like metal transporter [Lactarius indigo]|nr:CDF-like metal transporter [Lactarius indigo]
MASLPTTILGFRLSYHLRSRPVPPLRWIEGMRRQIHGNGVDKGKHPESEHRSNHSQPTSHSHSHGILGGHSHSHEHGGDRGSRVTLIGLGANILLTSAKGAAGWSMNSAALLADAGHSLSDLLGDFVVLISWRLSRRPPSRRYPFGLAKFETVGTGLTASSVAAGPPAHHIPAIGQFAHSHAHHAHALDLNAAWFAAVGVASKEWLFRITRKVAEQEGSLIVSFVIFGQGLSVLKGAFWEMTDASVSKSILQSLSRPLDRLVEDPRWSTDLLHVHDLRARRAGSQLFVDFSAGVPGNKEMVAALKAERKDVKEVHAAEQERTR